MEIMKINNSNNSFIKLPDGRIRVIDHTGETYGHISYVVGTGYVYKPLSINHQQYIVKVIGEKLLMLTIGGE